MNNSSTRLPVGTHKEVISSFCLVGASTKSDTISLSQKVADKHSTIMKMKMPSLMVKLLEKLFIFSMDLVSTRRKMINMASNYQKIPQNNINAS